LKISKNDFFNFLNEKTCCFNFQTTEYQYIKNNKRPTFAIFTELNNK
jgi:hypothetical protein